MISIWNLVWQKTSFKIYRNFNLFKTKKVKHSGFRVFISKLALNQSLMNTPTPSLENLTNLIKRILPAATILFILASYLIMSVVNTLFLDLPKVLAILCSTTLAFGRFLIICKNRLKLTRQPGPN